MSKETTTRVGGNVIVLPVPAAKPAYQTSCDVVEQSSVHSSLLDRDAQKLEHPQASEDTPQQMHATSTKTSIVVVGSYLTAWVLAAVHCVFFRVLDGKDVLSFFVLRQSRVSIISLLLVTAFRAAIIIVLGTCFTQYLWLFLRRRCLRIGLIDELFQIRSNILEMANPKIIRQAPLLFFVATLTWLVPLATVYPPGALTVQSELHTSFSVLNASVMNPLLLPEDVIGWGKPSNIPSLASIIKGESWGRWDQSPTSSPKLDRRRDYVEYRGPGAAFQSMTNFIMSSGQIVSLGPLMGENSSHVLSFEGPRLRCENSTSVVIMPHPDWRNERPNLVMFNSSWSDTFPVDAHAIFTLVQTIPEGFYEENNNSSSECADSNCTSMVRGVTAMMVLKRRIMKCQAHTATYRVNVSHTRGMQNVIYDTDEEAVLQFPHEYGIEWNATEHGNKFNETKAYKDWAASVPVWLRKATSRAIFDSVGVNLVYQWRQMIHIRSRSETILKPYTLPNGTEVQLDEILETSPYNNNNYTRLEDSALNRHRFKQTYVRFDPRDALDITEAALNQILANVTISALSLNTWYSDITVKDSRSRNIYRFSDPLNFFLPYGLCLGLTLISISLGLYALRVNGTPATDGGFLQIMMTTRGETLMSQEVKTGSLGGRDNAPQALLNMQVRFGQLISEGKTASEDRHGFGTAEETVPITHRN